MAFLNVQAEKYATIYTFVFYEKQISLFSREAGISKRQRVVLHILQFSVGILYKTELFFNRSDTGNNTMLFITGRYAMYILFS